MWEPGEVALATPWQPDGPALPLEFARIAGDGRLTLVLHPAAATSVPVCWALAAWAPIPAVVENLRAAERTVPGHIGSLPPQGSLATPLDRVVEQAITTWQTAQNLDAVVWNNLPANFTARTGHPLTPEAIVAYLRGLPGPERRRAEAYVRRVPAAIQTPNRAAIMEAFGWQPL